MDGDIIMNKTSEYISDTSKEYSLYTSGVRAIPKVTDGLKDGQRKGLWSLRNKADKIKTMAAASLPVYEGLYVHGNTSIEDAISRLAAPFLNNVCFLDGIGAFGSKLSPDSFGAARYTHVQRAKAAQSILFEDLDIVPVMENYDGSNFSASTFLPIIPTVLLNGVSGIAVGWSTEILPHRLSDLIDGCVTVLNNKEVKQLVPYYNFYNLDIHNIEGSSWLLRGKLEIENSTTVMIKELPPGMKIEKFKEYLDSLEEADKIHDYIDKSTKTVDIKVIMKREQLRGKTVEDLMALFKIQVRITERIVVVGFNGKIKVYESHNDLFQDFVAWRLGWYRTRYENLLQIARKDLNYNRAIEECFKQKLPQKILSLSNKQAVRELVLDITKKFGLEDDQVEKIVSMPSYRWAIDCLKEIPEKIVELNMMIDIYVGILADENEIKKIYKQELQDLKKVKF